MTIQEHVEQVERAKRAVKVAQGCDAVLDAIWVARSKVQLPNDPAVQAAESRRDYLLGKIENSNARLAQDLQLSLESAKIDLIEAVQAY